MSTPNYNLPFPVLGDVPNVPADVQALAEAVDSALDGTVGGTVIRGGNLQVDLSASADSAPVPIGHTYPDNQFSVVFGLSTGNNAMVIKVSTRTPSTFTVRGYDASGAQIAGTVRVHWLTIGPAA